VRRACVLSPRRAWDPPRTSPTCWSCPLPGSSRPSTASTWTTCSTRRPGQVLTSLTIGGTERPDTSGRRSEWWNHPFLPAVVTNTREQVCRTGGSRRGAKSYRDASVTASACRGGRLVAWSPRRSVVNRRIVTAERVSIAVAAAGTSASGSAVWAARHDQGGNSELDERSRHRRVTGRPREDDESVDLRWSTGYAYRRTTTCLRPRAGHVRVARRLRGRASGQHRPAHGRRRSPPVQLATTTTAFRSSSSRTRCPPHPRQGASASSPTCTSAQPGREPRPAAPTSW